jgi:putative redox protein
MLSVKMNWAGGVRFEGTGSFGHKIVTDVKKESGGEESGFRATELLLFGVAACTGVDVVRIMKKQRQELTGLEIEVIGHQNEEYPKPFHTIEIKYTFRGKNLNPQKVQRSIDLSEEKYCVVSQTIQCSAEVKSSVELVED